MLNLNKEKPAINLTKANNNKTKYAIGLAWDNDADYDASVVVMKNGSREDLVYYGNPVAAGIKHDGDATDGSAEGDDETIHIDLGAVAGDELIVAITSYRCGTFNADDNPMARLYNEGESQALIEADLASEAAFGTAVTMVRFFKEGSDWKFENISATIGSSSNGLEDVIAKYK